MNLGCAKGRVYVDDMFWISNVVVTSGDRREASSLVFFFGLVREQQVVFSVVAVNVNGVNSSERDKSEKRMYFSSLAICNSRRRTSEG